MSSVHEKVLLKNVLQAWKEYAHHLAQNSGFSSELTEVEWDDKSLHYGAADSALTKLAETYPESATFDDDKQHEWQVDELSNSELEDLVEKAAKKIKENQKLMAEVGGVTPTNFDGGEMSDASGKPIRD